MPTRNSIDYIGPAHPWRNSFLTARVIVWELLDRINYNASYRFSRNGYGDSYEPGFHDRFDPRTGLGISRWHGDCRCTLRPVPSAHGSRAARRFAAKAAARRRAGALREPALLRRAGLPQRATRAGRERCEGRRAARRQRVDSGYAGRRYRARRWSPGQRQQSEGSQSRKHASCGSSRHLGDLRQRHAGGSALPRSGHHTASRSLDRSSDLSLQGCLDRGHVV